MKKGEDLKKRTKDFALCAIRFVESLPSKRSLAVLSMQLLRAATSVGANYRAACRAKSKADFIAKLGIVEEEADESSFWLELIEGSGLARSAETTGLLREANEITAITVASINKARGSSRNSSSPRNAKPLPSAL